MGKECKTSTITSKNIDANNHKPLDKDIKNNSNDNKNDTEIKMEIKQEENIDNSLNNEKNDNIKEEIDINNDKIIKSKSQNKNSKISETKQNIKINGKDKSIEEDHKENKNTNHINEHTTVSWGLGEKEINRKPPSKINYSFKLEDIVK